MRSLILTAQLLFVLTLVFLYGDYFGAVSLAPKATGGMLLIGLVLGFLFTRKAPRRPRFILLGVYSLVIGAMPFITWNSRKPFLHDLDSIEVGMSRAEVEARMSRYMRGSGWPGNPLNAEAPLHDLSSGSASPIGTRRGPGGELELSDKVIYRHTNEGWGNSDWGIVTFENDRVVDVEFSPD